MIAVPRLLGRLGAALLVLATANAAEPPGGVLADVDHFPYVLGTQTIGVKYGFTEQTRLVETATAIRATGSNILKINLGPGTFAGYVLPRNEAITDLAGLVSREPSVQAVLAMPFAQYVMWANPFRGDDWRERFSAEDEAHQYREMYDLVHYLRTTFRGTGKSFWLGHWEGDWLLRKGRPDGGMEDQADPELITRMIAWLTVRQRAITEAKAATPDSDVAVWHYTEVNRVLDDLRPGHRGLTNSVLPHVDIDFVSYSAYDATNGDPATVSERLTQAIALIESRLRPRPDLPGRRVFIGEFGTPETAAGSPERYETLARNVFRAGLELDCPLVLFWEMYCNEIEKDGKHRGFWLIDDQGRRTSLHRTFTAFHTQARAWVTAQLAATGKLPDREAYRRQALVILAGLPPP